MYKTDVLWLIVHLQFGKNIVTFDIVKLVFEPTRNMI